MKNLLYISCLLGIASVTQCMDPKQTKDLHRAIGNNSPSKVTEYLENGADPDILIKYLNINQDLTALHLVAKALAKYVDQQEKDLAQSHNHGLTQNRYDTLLANLSIIVQSLLQYGANASIVNPQGQTALDIIHNIKRESLSSRQNTYLNDIIEQLQNTPSPVQRLFDAILSHDVFSVSRLIKNAAINPINQQGNTPLHIATNEYINILTTSKQAYNDNALQDIKQIINLLLNKNANPSIKNRAGDTPWDILNRYAQNPNQQSLSEKYKKDITNILSLLMPNASLHKAIEQLDVDTVLQLLANNMNANATDPYGNTPLNTAANMIIVTYTTEKYRYTILPVFNKLNTIIRALLNNKADKSIKNNFGRNPWDQLNRFNQEKGRSLSSDQQTTLKEFLMLLDPAAQQKPQSESQPSPSPAHPINQEALFDAIKQINTNLVSQLLKRVNVNSVDQNGNTPLNVAASMIITICTSEQHKNTLSSDLNELGIIIRTLLNNKADKSIKNNAGKNPWDKLNRFNQEEGGSLPLDQQTKLKELLILLDPAAQQKPQSESQSSPSPARPINQETLYDAIKQLNTNLVSQLLKRVNVNSVDQNGNTPLNVAASMIITICTSEQHKNTISSDLNKLDTIIRALLNNKADKSIKNNAGKNPWDKLNRFNQEEGQSLPADQQATLKEFLILLDPAPQPQPSPSKSTESISEQAWSQFPEAKKLRNQYKHMQEVYRALLGVGPRASKTEINKAYRQLSRKWHPDKYEGDKELANAVQTLLNTAKKALDN